MGAKKTETKPAVKATAAKKAAAPKKAAPAAKPAATKKATPAAKPAAAKKAAPAAKPAAKKAAPAAKPAAAKKTAAAPKRVVPKTSPLAGTSVDAYVAKLRPAHAKIIGVLRAIVREHAPEASEVIKWAQPVLEHNGPMAFIKASKNHVTMGFWRGAELRAPAGLLDGAGDRMKHVKIGLTAQVPVAVIADLVRQAVALNEAKGDPTKRG